MFAPSVELAQQKEKSAETKSVTILPSTDLSKEAVVYEQVRGHLRYDADGSGSNVTYARIRVQSYAGVQRVGQLIFNYDSANAQFEVRLIRVTKSDGKIVVAGPEAIQDMTSPIAQAAPTYTDVRQKHVVVPDLSPGDTLEYETLTTYRPSVPGKVWQAWDFINDDICLDEEVELDAASRLSIHTTTTGGANDPETTTQGDRTLWTWKTSHPSREAAAPLWVPSAKNPFPDARQVLGGTNRQSRRRIWITSFASWAEIAAVYSSLEQDRRIPSPEVRAKAVELTRDANTDLEKTRAIYNYVARNIRYVSLSFGVGRYQPHAAADVLGHQYGDCKDKATLLESMLEAVGIRASPALLMASGTMDDVPSPLEFDHAISYVVLDGKDLWLDSTLGVAPFGYLLPNVRGKRALIATAEKGSQLVIIPADLRDPVLYDLSVDAKVDDDRKLDGHISFETRGDWEVLLRLALVQASLAQLQSTMEASAKKSGNEDFAIVEMDSSDPYDTSIPFRLGARITATMPESKEKDDQGKSTSTSSNSTLDSKSIQDFITLFLPEGMGNQALKLGDPRQFSFHLKLSLGPELTQKVIKKWRTPNPLPVHLVRDFASYDQNLSWNAPVVNADWKLATRVSSIPSDRISAYSAFRSSVEAEIKGLAYSLGAPSAEGRPSELTVRYSDSLDAIHSGKLAEAQQTLEAIVKDDPKYAEAWRSLAEVQARRKRWAEARASYQKLIELGEGDHNTYSLLINAYIADRLYFDAASTAKKQIEKYPNMADGHWNLGWALFLGDKFPESVAAYEAAAKLNAKNARLFTQLGRAYAANHQLEKARSAFDRAVQLDTSPLTLNDVAYFSAEAGLDLKLAEEQATRAVASTEQQISAIALKDVNPGTVGLLARLAAYWDTFGWIKFKEKDLQAAEKYLRAATDLSDEPTIQMHMGRIQESLGHKEAAMRCYVTALFATQMVQMKFAPQGGTGVPQPIRPLTPDELEAKRRLLALAGSQKGFDEQMKEGSYNRNWKRTVTVPYNEPKELEERGLVAIVEPGPKISENGNLPKMETQSTLLARFGERTPPQSFPDDDLITSIPRIGIIRCHTNPAQCEFEFLPNGQAEAVLAEMSKTQ